MFVSLFVATSVLGQNLTVTNDLQLWLRADAGVTVNSAGGVILWNDQSTNGNNALAPSDSVAPLLVANALNSKPVLRFDGADDYLDVPDSDSLSSPGDISSFFVVEFDDFGTYRAVWSKTVDNLPAPSDSYALPGSGLLRVFRGDGTFNNLSFVDTAQALRENTYLVLGFAIEGTNFTHYLNNQENGTGIVNTNTADGNTALKIGTRSDFATRLKGDLSELLIFSRALSVTERSNVFYYLQTKYNLLNLPPSVSLSSSPAGPDVNVGDIVTLNATANDLDGTIAKVDFFANGALIGTATVPPYSMPVKFESAGTAQFTARATDNKNAIANSAPISLTAGPAGSGNLDVTSGLQLWLRADAGATLNSGSVVQWADQSGNGNDAFQANVGLAPVLVNGVVNGLPAVRFDGTDDYMDVADSDSVSITGDISSFFVLRFSDFANYRAIWAKTVNNLPAPTDMYALPNNGRLRLYRGNGTGTGIQSSDSAQPFAAGTFLLGGFDIGGTAVRHFYNGIPNGIGSITVPSTDANGPLRIGSRGDLFTKMKGEIAEILIFSRSLPTADRRAVERYLVEKYALPALVSSANNSPSIVITGPSGKIFQAPDNLSVTVDATDNDGSIASVQFFANGIPIGIDTSPPYSASLSFAYGGSITLTAIATDNLGAVSSAVPVVLCVQGPGAPTGLVGYWRFDGDASAVIGTSGIMVSNPVPAMDRNGTPNGALSFDGNLQQRVEIPGGGGLNAAGHGTISMWVNWTGLQDAGFGGSFGAVLSRQRDGGFSDDIINLNNADPNNAAVQWRQAGAGVTLAGGTFVGSDTWKYIVIAFTETNSQLFIDGVAEASGGGGILHDNTATSLAIGAWTGGGGSYATATIDDVAIWSRVLSSDEIESLYFGNNTPTDLLITPDCLTIERSGSDVTIRWRSEGVLQSAPDVAGPYLDVARASNPYVTSAAGAPQFFRLRSP